MTQPDPDALFASAMVMQPYFREQGPDIEARTEGAYRLFTQAAEAGHTLAMARLVARRDVGLHWAIQLPATGSSYICVKDTIDNLYNNVLVRGAGRGHWGVQAGTGPVAGTKLLCNEGATTGVTALKHRSTAGASRGQLQGGGFENLDVWGAGIRRSAP